MENNNQVWCIPNDCIPFLAAATSWDQMYINLGNKFLYDTTDKILTQIRDLIDLDEPNINQDLLIANVSEKIFYDYRSITREIDKTYEQSINDVFHQYKNIISSRATSGDIPDECIKEIVCAMEQFKTRLLARAGKMMKPIEVSAEKTEIKHFDEENKRSRKYNNDNVAFTQDNIAKLKINEIDPKINIHSKQQEQIDNSKLIPNAQMAKKSSSNYETNSLGKQHILNEINPTQHKQKFHHNRKKHDYKSE
ncbi:unnamed protein product [Adineta steineri]|uniref:Uncharacterized protein n=1 Tax=Adineta steineri TaxID=433720 RepID=A0A815FFI7_9BILA|nr:unnamed protein product [Adineta steineri]CAF3856906.1 unnamed protein product [Adineta steineri]